MKNLKIKHNEKFQFFFYQKTNFSAFSFNFFRSEFVSMIIKTVGKRTPATTDPPLPIERIRLKILQVEIVLFFSQI